jgi:hypothetical protein
VVSGHDLGNELRLEFVPVIVRAPAMPEAGRQVLEVETEVGEREVDHPGASRLIAVNDDVLRSHVAVDRHLWPCLDLFTL